MKLKPQFSLLALVFAFTICAPFVLPGNHSAHAQNRISGFVFGLNRQPMRELHVELINNYGFTELRTRTNSSGYYSFSGMSEGRFVIKVRTDGTDYEEGESPVEIDNFVVSNSEGKPRAAGFDHPQVDVHLKLRKGVTVSNAVVFAQDVPPQAKKLFEKALNDLDGDRNSDAQASLNAALEIFPTYYVALELLGTEYIKLGRREAFQEAVTLLTKAVGVYPRGFRSWHGLAYAQYSLGNFPEALIAVEKAVELNAASIDAVFLSGVVLKKLKKYSEAEKQLLKAKELSKDTIASIHWELATLYGRILNRYADAARELKLFLKAQPGSKDADNIRKLIADFEAKAQAK